MSLITPINPIHNSTTNNMRPQKSSKLEQHPSLEFKNERNEELINNRNKGLEMPELSNSERLCELCKRPASYQGFLAKLWRWPKLNSSELNPRVPSIQIYGQDEQLGEDIRGKLERIANVIRGLSMDAVEYAGSGHAGTPMGCAEIGAYLYGYYLRLSPSKPGWINRDRFILSAGHAAMLQYSCLHMCGYKISLDDLKKYRQIGSKTPSHPQYGTTDGVETTTGVDGQGIANGIGQALGLKILGSRFNTEDTTIYDAKVVILAGDGCFMEGVSHEACSIAGHLNLNNVILIYDFNKTCLDGYVSESCSENTEQRYKAYGWDVYNIDGHNIDEVHSTLSRLRNKQDKPTLVIAHTVIGKGAPNLASSYLVHNNPLGDELTNAKRHLGLPLESFYIPKAIYKYFGIKMSYNDLIESKWNNVFLRWQTSHPHLAKDHAKMTSKILPQQIEEKLSKLSIPEEISGRKASNLVLNFLEEIIPGLYGGSADLARSDMTFMHKYSSISSNNFSGRNIKYGVREFGMGAMANGLSQIEGIRPFVGTFLAFSDYMLNSIRMAALMELQVIYQFTHDSIFIGQDGPTHQPIEHLAHLRGIPNLQVIRPADGNEVKMAWLAALTYSGPTAIILSRQKLKQCSRTNQPYLIGLGRGAYVVKESKKNPDFTLIATGSEVFLAESVASVLEEKGFFVKVVSMPSWEIYDRQPKEYKDSILNEYSGRRISIEAASEMGWHKYILDGLAVSINAFGYSGKSIDVAEKFEFTVDQIVKKIISSNPSRGGCVIL